jgi:hypothetical protein
MERPSPKQAILARFNDFTICIKMLLDAGHTLPALVLLYSAIDVFASLMRPETEPDTTGGHFKKWAEDYMIGRSRLTITSADLWGARCGLLHTHSPSSRDSRQAKARKLAYYRARTPTPDMQRVLESTLKLVRTRGELPADVDFLYAAFEDGVRRFLADIQRDPELERRAVHHSSKLFGVLNYVADQ